jgi:hypothetical protein
LSILNNRRKPAPPDAKLRCAWKKFNYQSLYEEAKAHNLFTAEDAKLLADLDGTNLEQVHYALSTAPFRTRASGKWGLAHEVVEPLSMRCG